MQNGTVQGGTAVRTGPPAVVPLPLACPVVEYRVDDLARAAGTTVRKVRLYQDRGLLPPPRRAGRLGWYGEAHLARLRLIGRLLDRGFTFAHIAEMLSAWQQGRDLADLLGLEEALTSPWTDELPATYTLAELRRLFGQAITPGAVRRAVSLGLLEPAGASYRARSPRLLGAGAELVRAGVPLPAVLDLAEQLSADMTTVARRFVQLVFDELVAPRGVEAALAPAAVGELVGLVRRLRPLAQRAVEATLAAAMEDQVGALLGDAVLTLVRRQRGLGGAGAGAVTGSGGGDGSAG